MFVKIGDDMSRDLPHRWIRGALHLAICADHGATLCALDHTLPEASPALGAKTILL